MLQLTNYLVLNFRKHFGNHHIYNNNQRNSRGPSLHLTSSAQRLLQALLAPATRKAYQHSWKLFFSWADSISLPVKSITLCNFIGRLFDIGYSPSSISSPISAVAYIHKIFNMPEPAKCFLVQKMLKGCHKVGPTVDSRLPITGEILIKIVNALRHTIPNHAQMLLVKALFLIAFHGIYRLGELVITSKTRAEFVIQRSDVRFEVMNNKLKHVQLILRHFKTISLGQPRFIT